jgi:hypothetical protein
MSHSTDNQTCFGSASLAKRIVARLPKVRYRRSSREREVGRCALGMSQLELGAASIATLPMVFGSPQAGEGPGPTDLRMNRDSNFFGRHHRKASHGKAQSSWHDGHGGFTTSSSGWAPQPFLRLHRCTARNANAAFAECLDAMTQWGTVETGPREEPD